MFRKSAFFLIFAAVAAFAQTGIITTVVGNGTRGFSGDGGAATDARLDFGEANPAIGEEDIIKVALDAAGNLYIPDRNNSRIRKVTTDGKIATIAGDGSDNYGGDGGPALNAQFSWPTAVALDSAGNIFIADYYNCAIRKIDAQGIITLVAGIPTSTCGSTGNGNLATEAKLGYPIGVALDKDGNIYISDEDNSWIRKVSAADGRMTVFAGDATKPRNFAYGGDNGPATAAALDYPGGITLDAAGNVFFADQYNHRIRKVALDGTITTVAGSGVRGFSGDGGPATSARLNFPADVAVDSAGNLYIVDYDNFRIRKVATNGIITTVAGNGTAAYNGDNIAADQASLNFPSGVTVDPAGNLYITDHYNHRIRKVTFGAGGGIGFPSNGVVSAASFAGGHIAPGQIISIFGTNLGPATGVEAALDPATGRLSTSRGGTSVTFDDIDGPLFYVRQDQINVQAPYELVGKTSTRVVVKTQAASSTGVNVPVGPTAPGIFAVSAGKGQAAMLNQDSTVNSASNGAAIGSVVQIFVTGQGATNPAAVTGQLTQGTFPEPTAPVAVTIGGINATVVFKGLAPSLAGLLQVNAVVPAGVTPGPSVPLTVTIGGAATQTGVTLSIKP